jgi:hypothetical protein
MFLLSCSLGQQSKGLTSILASPLLSYWALRFAALTGWHVEE